MSIKDDSVLFIKTIQTGAFKTLFNALKDIIIECNLIFTPEGIKIVNMDKTQTVVVYLDLPADKFEEYVCTCEKILICINLQHFVRVLGWLDTNDTLVMYIDNKHYDDGFVSSLTIRIESKAINQIWTTNLHVVDAASEDTHFPEMKFTTEITMPSIDFQKNIRALSNLTNKIEIKAVGDELNFNCSGQVADSNIMRPSSVSSTNKEGGSMEVVQGVFSSRTLSNFIKCTNLCPQIVLYLGNNLPLVVQYSVANLGILRLCLAQKQTGAEYTD
jgi:proliferating cell nuclear antigen